MIIIGEKSDANERKEKQKKMKAGTNLCLVLCFIVQSGCAEIHVSEVCYMPWTQFSGTMIFTKAEK